jgi:peptidoglycan/xylan/chitin deacetylase (PgdA/CDA1 family)
LIRRSIGRCARLAASAASVALLVGLLGHVASAAPRTVVTFTFDNNTASQYTLGYQQALLPHAMSGTFFASSGTVGTGPGFMSWAQLTDLQANGNEIGGRTTHFTDLTAVPTQTATEEACGDRQALIQHGLNLSSFAYPFGAFNPAVEAIVASCGYGVARSGGGIAPGGSNVSGPIPASDPLVVAAYAPSGPITATVLESLVTDASAQNGGWIPVVIQNVCSQSLDPANYANCQGSWGNIELSELNAFLDWLAAAGQAGGAPADSAVQTMRALATSVDTTAPTTTLTCDGAPCTTDPYGNFTNVTLASTDLGSGVSSTHYTTDGSDPTLSSPTYTGPFPQSSSATLRFRSWDLAGNASAIGSQDLAIVPLGPDNDAPVSTITCNGSPCMAAAYTRAVTVALSAADGHGSGVDTIRYTTDGSAPTATSPVYAAPFDVQQTTTVNFLATDRAGNAEVVQTQLVQITASPVRISFGWDDGKFSLYNLAWQRALQPHNVRSTFYINSGDVGTGESGPTTPGFMTWANLAELYAAGNEIGGHTVNHINLAALPDDASRIHQACDDRQALLLHGLHPTSFAYPEGAVTAHIQDIIRSCGYSNARSGGGLTPNGPTYAETVPPADMFATRTWASPNGKEITLADLQQEVLAASSHGGGWLQIQGHMVCSQQFFASDYADCIQYYGYMELTTLNTFLDWLQSAGLPGGAPAGVTTQTVRQVIGPVPSSDVTPPTTTISCNGAACTTAAYAAGMSVRLNATDTGSGVERTVFTTDGSDPITSATVRLYTGPFTLSATSTVRYLSVDQAMNAETRRSQRITVTAADLTAPVTTIRCDVAACSTGWYRTTVSVTFTATDAGGSGLASTHYTIDGTAPSLTSPLYAGPVPVSQTTTVRYASWDGAGNKEANKTATIRIDAAGPTVAITSPLNGATVRRSVASAVSATAADVGTGTGAASGVRNVAWYLDGSATALRTDSSNPYSFNWTPGTTVALGTHTMTAVATDVAGNTKTSVTITFTISA